MFSPSRYNPDFLVQIKGVIAPPKCKVKVHTAQMYHTANSVCMQGECNTVKCFGGFIRISDIVHVAGTYAGGFLRFQETPSVRAS